MTNQESIAAEVIAIGDELSSGQRLDTNSQWLAQQLGDLGIRALFHTTVADDLDSNIAAFRIASERVNLIIATGGLGPTADDLTRESIAQAFDRPLILHEPSLCRIQRMFTDRGREMPERNRVQALFPEGSTPVLNPHGTAPGIDFVTTKGCRLFALPGVPAEMKEMYAGSIRPALLQQFGARLRPLRHYRIKCFGTGESALEAMLPDVIQRGREPSVGITVSKATITLRVSAQAESDEAFAKLIEPTVSTIRQTLGPLVFGEEDEELQHAVFRLLQSREQTVAISEWGTSGLIAQWLQELANNDQTPTLLAGANIITNQDNLVRSMGINSTELSAQELAKEMAIAARKQASADLGLSAGPFPNSSSNDAKVFFGLATPNESAVIGRRFAGHPSILKPRAAKQALDVLRLHLLNT